ncbi:unnamed protein product [Oikopleura dioica]|uniref:Uncharacterized protein n=1 Tax=Oikopleura dioica TaxID=34765 RepID=E4XQQ8_OIKDI|nr:unnamed protein product [Oikopleura dioica]
MQKRASAESRFGWTERLHKMIREEWARRSRTIQSREIRSRSFSSLRLHFQILILSICRRIQTDFLQTWIRG